MFSKNNNHKKLTAGGVSGQSAVEYLLLVAAVVVVFISFFTVNGWFQGRVETLVNGPVDQLDDMARNLPFP